MPKETKAKKAGSSLRHTPLGSVIEDAENQQVKEKSKASKGKKGKKSGAGDDDDMGDLIDYEDVPSGLSNKMLQQTEGGGGGGRMVGRNDDAVVQKEQAGDSDSDEYNDDLEEEEEDEDYEEMVETDAEGNYIAAGGDLSESEEAVVQQFLNAGRDETRNLADIIMEKLQEKGNGNGEEDSQGGGGMEELVPSKVSEVFVSVGSMLKHYRSGKLPKALKMLPHLKNWEQILWLTRPDEWSPAATYATTRIFASNLNVKLAQRYYNLVLLEKCRDDIQTQGRLNYYLYLALKKALFKPAAFYKGILLPLAQSLTCTVREAQIMGSVIMKVSIPGNHSAAVLLRLVEMPYSGATSIFIKCLLNKKYALPRRVIEALTNHFYSFLEDTRELPVIWHQCLLMFAQRYKFELNDSQKERFKELIKTQFHHSISPEVRRELFVTTNIAMMEAL